MERKLKILPPTMPNFFFYEQGVGKREDGYNPSPGISITELSEEEAIEFGEMLKDCFIKHWRNKKRGPHVLNGTRADS